MAEAPVDADTDIDTAHYPDSDGHFLPDNPLQANAIVDVRSSLKQHFSTIDNVVLEGDMFIYFEKGNPRESIAPDVFVVRNHDLGQRRVYKLWEEGKPPDFALEVISPERKIRNEVDKRDLYERLGIGEYFLFQPDPGEAGRRLVGYRLRGRFYDEVEPEPTGGLLSEALGVEFQVEGTGLRLLDTESGREYCWPEEYLRNTAVIEARAERAEAKAERAEAKAERAEAKAESEAVARRRAEARIAELEARLRQAGH